jgi:hypothetical protein
VCGDDRAFAGTQPQQVYERGRDLERAGAWLSSASRARSRTS